MPRVFFFIVLGKMAFFSIMAPLSAKHVQKQSISSHPIKANNNGTHTGLNLVLESLIFMDNETWGFWLNGVYIDSTEEGRHWLKKQGLEVIRVEEKGVLIGFCDSRKTRFLKPCSPNKRSVKIERPKKGKGKAESPKKKRQVEKETGTLGF